MPDTILNITDHSEWLTESTGTTVHAVAIKTGVDPSNFAKKVKRPDELLWHRANGQPLLKLTGSSFFHGAVKRRMAVDQDFPRLSPHGLRHVAAGLMVSSGANVKVVQRQMGHSSAVETLNRYADLFDGDLDAVADRMDEILGSASNVRQMKKEATPDDSESGL